MVDLQAGDPQTGDAVLLDPLLPGKEFFLRKFIAVAGFLETDGTATHRADDRSFAPRDPAFCVWGRQVDSSKAGAHQVSPLVNPSVFSSRGDQEDLGKTLDTTDSNEYPHRSKLSNRIAAVR